MKEFSYRGKGFVPALKITLIAATAISSLIDWAGSAVAAVKAEKQITLGGVAAVFSSSGLTYPDQQALMNQELIRQDFNGESMTIEQAIQRAKAATNDLDVRRTGILFGDPTIRLKY
jgi:type IV secretory pathway TrbF-like protein